MLLGTLCASLFRNLLKRRGVNRAGTGQRGGINRAGERVLRAVYGSRFSNMDF